MDLSSTYSGSAAITGQGDSFVEVAQDVRRASEPVVQTSQFEKPKGPGSSAESLAKLGRMCESS